MEVAFFKFAFFVVMGLAILSLLALITMFTVLGLRVLWSSLPIHTRIAKTGHV
jgi:hypothetical protein